MQVLFFSIPLLIEDKGEEFYERNKFWIDDCKSKQVTFRDKESEWGLCFGNFYNIHRNWCTVSLEEANISSSLKNTKQPKSQQKNTKNKTNTKTENKTVKNIPQKNISSNLPTTKGKKTQKSSTKVQKENEQLPLFTDPRPSKTKSPSNKTTTLKARK